MTAERPAGGTSEGTDAGRLRRLQDFGRTQVEGGRRRAADLLERHGHRPLVGTALAVHERDREAAGTVVGSALALRLFLFFVPFLVFLVGLAGLTSHLFEPEDVNEQIGVTGVLAEQISAAFAQSATAGGIAAASGLVGMVWAGRALSKVLIVASSLTWRLPVRPTAPIRVVGGVVGVLASLALASIVVNRIRAELGLPAAGASFAAVTAFYVVAWLLLLRMLPRPTQDPGALLPTAALIGVVLAAAQAGAQLYLSRQLGRASALYGTIGASVVTLGWFFIMGRIVVFAMAVGAVVYERFGSLSHVVFALPGLRILPRRSPRLRRAFGLDEPGGPLDEA